jgi:hypothetical protein
MTLKQFAKELAKIHNDSGLLYKDMLDQETLFDVQEKITDLLLSANQKGALSNENLFEFNHVFKTYK